MYNDDVTCTVAAFGRRCKALGLNCGEAVCRWFSIHTYPVDVKSNFDGVQIKPEVTVLVYFFLLFCDVFTFQVIERVSSSTLRLTACHIHTAAPPLKCE